MYLQKVTISKGDLDKNIYIKKFLKNVVFANDDF